MWGANGEFPMKIPSSGLILFLFAICVAAQTSSGAPGVTVLESKWRIDIYNPALDKDPLAPSKERLQEALAQNEAATQSESRVAQGGSALPPVVRQSTSDTGNRKLQVTYVYELKVKNTGPKEIRLLIWEYIFLEPGTTQEAGRRRFISRQSIKPGATRELIVRSPTSPTGTLDASKAGRKTNEQYSEKVVIRNIGYADGSNWPAPRIR